MNDTTDNNTSINTETNDNIDIDQTILTQKQPKISLMLSAFRNLDKVCYQLGLLNKNSSLATKINWTQENDLPEILNQLDNTRDQIEQQIVKLKRLMANHCITIIVWEFIILFTISSSLLAVSFFESYWNNGVFSPPWLNEVLSRPILITVSSFLLISGFVILHYSLRNFFAKRIANTILKTESKFTLANAFLLNSKFSHSMFRPEPVGLHWINRRRLQNAHDLFLSYSLKTK